VNYSKPHLVRVKALPDRQGNNSILWNKNQDKTTRTTADQKFLEAYQNYIKIDPNTEMRLVQGDDKYQNQKNEK